MTFAQDLVDKALSEWEFFGRGLIRLNGTEIEGIKEYKDGAWQRIGDYWQFIGGSYKNLTGKDRGYPWSAAFISFCMNEAGAGKKFKYSAGHATYINESIKARNAKDKNALYMAKHKKEVALKAGDLIGYWRGDKKITIENALKTGWYKSHTDIVVEVKKNFALVVGGNVDHSVTIKEVRVNSNGQLTDIHKNWFVVMSLQA